MQITAIGTVWSCELDMSEHASEQPDDTYTIQFAESLPGKYMDNGPRGQVVKFTLDSAEPLDEGHTYRVTASVTTILPTQEDDDLYVLGRIVEAKLIE